MEQQNARPAHWSDPAFMARSVAVAVAVALLYLLSRANYLLFHSIVEVFAITVAVSIFVVAWHTRKWASASYLLFLGIAYLAVAVVDAFHTFSYQGMGVFPGFGANEATQFWILARYIEGFSLLLLPVALARRMRPVLVAGMYACIAGLGLVCISPLGLFPDCFVAGQGLTSFKIASEYVICLAVAGGIVLLIRRRERLSSRVFRLLLAAMAITIAAEMTFTLYTDVYGIANAIGHLFKVVSFLLMYQAVAVTSLSSPYELVFRDLVQSRDRAQTYLNMAGTMLLALDMHGVVTLVNRCGAEILGYPEEEILGRNWFECFLPQSAQQEVRGLFAALVRGDSETAEYAEGSVLTARGEERLIAWHCIVLRDEHGAVNGVISSGEDITERRRAEMRLQESEQRFRLLFERAPDAYFLVDSEGRLVDVNLAAARLMGYERQELVGRTSLECGLLLPEDVPLAMMLLSRNLRGESTGPDEITLVDRQGWPIPVDIRTEPVSLGGKTLLLGMAHDISERKAAAERIRLERDRFLSLFANSAEAIALLDEDHRVVDVNAAFSRLFGYDLEAAEGKRIETLLVPPGLQHEAQELALSGQARRVGTVIDTVRRSRDGSTLAVSISHVPITSEGRFVGVFAMYRDIGERKRADEALQASEAKFRSLFEQSLDAIYLHGYDGTHLEANQAWLDMFGFRKEELPFINSARDIYVDPNERVDFLRRIEKTGMVADDVRFKKKDGSVMLCQRTVVARRDAQGKIVELRGIIRDVTERRRAEEMVRRSEEQYRSLFEQSRDGIFLVSVDGRILNVNAAAEKLVGYERSELLGMNVAQLYVDPTCRPALVAALNAEGGLVDYPMEIRREDGGVLDCEISATFMRDGDDAVFAYQTSVRDVTERKRAEQAIRMNEARLGTLVDMLQDDSPTLQEFLDNVLNHAVVLTESKLGYIYFYDEAKRQLTLNSWSRGIMKECTIEKPRFVYHLDRTGIWGEAIRQRRPIIVNDFDAPNPLKRGYPTGHVKLHKFATIPVFSGGHIVAVLGVANKDTDYTDADVLQLTLLMDSVWREVERKRSEARVREFSQLLERAMSAGNLAWWQMELPSERISFDVRKATMLGYAPSQFSYHNDFLALLSPEDRQVAIQAMRDCLEGKAERYEVEYRARASDGGYRWFSDVAEVTERDAHGTPSLVTGIVVDISRLKRAEERLSRSNQDLHTLAARLNLTREEERARVAWELHDEVAQALSIIRLDIISCDGDLPESVRNQIQSIMGRTVSLLDTTIERLRRLYMDLVPVMLEDLGLAAAIEWHAQQYASQASVAIEVGRVEDLVLADEPTALGLFRILEELLVHMSGHPGITRLMVNLSGDNGEAVLSVSDDGHDSQRVDCEESCDVVLAGVRERARYWGGGVTVDTSAAGGKVIRVTAPLRPQRQPMEDAG